MILIAQTGPGFGDFLRQIPLMFVLCLCGSGVLLTVALFAIVRARVGRGNTQAESLPSRPARPPQPKSSIAADDKPDLDLLLDAAPPPPPANPARAVRKGTFTVQVSSGEAAQAVEVVTILRDVVEGGLIIQMGDRVYRDLSHDESFRASFLKIMRELSPLVKQSPQAAESASVEDQRDQSVSSSSSTPAATISPSLRDLLDSDETFDEVDELEPPLSTTPPPPRADGTMPGDLPKYSLDKEPETVKKRGTLGRTKTEYKPVPELDIAGAIEAYLQHKLVHTPTFSGRSIHVHPSPDGGVAIEVDGAFYDSVNDVSEVPVQDFLSETIREWQQRNIGA